VTDCALDLTTVITHFASAGSAFLGGTSMMVYMQPSTIREAVVRILVSVGSGVTLAPAITHKIFDDPATDYRVVAGVSFAVGFIAWSALGSVARYFEHRRNQDAEQMIKEAKK